MQRMRSNDVSRAKELALASLGFAGFNADQIKPVGKYLAVNHAVRPGFEQEYREIRAARDKAWAARDFAQAGVYDDALIRIPKEEAWRDSYYNLVVTVGKNDWLDKWLAGSAYTAAFYIGLISATSYTTGPAAGDTMASHGGWTEFVGYSNASRPTTAWSSASGGIKALSAGLVYNINAGGTVKGSFLTTNNSKSVTTGILGSAGLFNGGDQPVVDTNALTVNYALSLT